MPASPPNIGATGTCLVAALVVPYSRALEDPDGREYLQIVTHALAGRARLLERTGPPALTHEHFVEDLVAMSIGALAAPACRSLGASAAPPAARSRAPRPSFAAG